MKTLLLILATGLSLFAAPRTPVVAAVNAKEIAFWYLRPDTSTCTWSVSLNSSYSPLVADVTATPTDAANAVVGERWYVVGAGTALTASTLYYWRQVCGGETYTGTVTTPVAQAVPVGGVYNWAIGAGTSPGANSMSLLTGVTPALGTTATITCSMSCATSGTKAPDTLLFYQYLWQNAGTTLASMDTIRVLP